MGSAPATDGGLAKDDGAEIGAARSAIAARSVRAGMNSLISGFLIYGNATGPGGSGQRPTCNKPGANASMGNDRTSQATVPALTTS
jgi:hypothetical protein